MGRLLCALAVLAWACTARADAIGRATVIDGDTLEIAGQRVRLWGVDAFESRQLCAAADARPYRCGQRGALELADWIGQRRVVCRERDRDRYGRSVARCTVARRDVARWLVLNGHALDYARYSKGAYARAEGSARRAKRGAWAGAFQEPWEWRAAQRGMGRSGAREGGRR